MPGVRPSKGAYYLGVCIARRTGRIVLFSWGLFIMCGTGSDQ